MARIISVVNQKGGVGKTTTAVNLSASLAIAEHQTLLVDLDPQGNATTALGLAKSRRAETIYQVLLGEAPTESAIVRTELEFLSLVPADIDLVGAEVELVPLPDRELRLRKGLASVAGKFDFILVDCPPSLGLLTVNALSAAGSVLIPLQCEFFALEGLTKLLKTIRLVRERLNSRLEIEGILLTMFDARTTLASQVMAEVRKYFEGQLFRTVIPRNVRLTEAPSHGQPAILYDLRSAGAISYLELTKEVMTND